MARFGVFVMDQQRRTVRFFGCVQGVGFRYTARQIAGSYNIAGYIRNLSDGSVESVIEGSKPEIDAFLADLSGRMTGYIDRTNQQTADYVGEFSDFTVKF